MINCGNPLNCKSILLFCPLLFFRTSFSLLITSGSLTCSNPFCARCLIISGSQLKLSRHCLLKIFWVFSMLHKRICGLNLSFPLEHLFIISVNCYQVNYLPPFSSKNVLVSSRHLLLFSSGSN